MPDNQSPIEISDLSAYAEDPRSYCYYKGIPRSIHNNSKTNSTTNINPLSSRLTQYLLYSSVLFLALSGASLWIYLE